MRVRPSRHPQIVVLSDRALVRECIVALLRRLGFADAAGRTGWAALSHPAAMKGVGLVLVDLGHRAEDPHEILRKVAERWPDATAVAIGSAIQLAAQAAGADGWIDVSDGVERLSRIAAAAARPHHGRLEFRDLRKVERYVRTWSALSRRQRQVLALLGCGLDNHKLAASLGVSERAVKAHVSALLDAFKADGRAELAIVACNAGLRCATCAPSPWS